MADLFPQQVRAGTTFIETVDATAKLEKRYQWDITKTAVPNVLNLFRNDSGTVQYTVTVINDSGTSEAYIEGQVCICNNGTLSTENLKSTLILTYPPCIDPVFMQALDVSGCPTLLAGQTHCYHYRINIPISSFVIGRAFKVTVHTTITNHSGHLGTPTGSTESADGTFPVTQVPVNQTIHVSNDDGLFYSFSATNPQLPQSMSYQKNYNCITQQGPHVNNATIDETGQTATTAVIVNCYDLIVTKTALPSFTRTYKWAICKRAVDETGTLINSLTLGLNQSYAVKYIIDLTPAYTDSNFMVTGEMTVFNPNPDRFANIMVSELVLPDAVNATVVPSSAAIPPNSSLTFKYTVDLSDASPRTIQAAALLYNIPSGTTPFLPTSVATNFSNADITEVDACINVVDSFAGQLNTLPICRHFTELSYTRVIGPYSSCSNATTQIETTATFTTTDTQTTGSMDWTIFVGIPCSGCSLTISFWKTHAGFGPGKQTDLVSELLPTNLGTPDGLVTVYVTTATRAVSILNFGGSNGVVDTSNGINRLYAQLFAAKLNIGNGADGSAIASAILSADAFLATHNSASWSTLNGADKDLVNDLQAIFDSYNSGLIGPGHCSEQLDLTSIQSSAGEAETDNVSTVTETLAVTKTENSVEAASEAKDTVVGETNSTLVQDETPQDKYNCFRYPKRC